MLPKFLVKPVNKAIDSILFNNLEAQSRKNGYDKLESKFSKLDIDLAKQYTENSEMTEFRNLKLKNQQTFQTLFATEMVEKYIQNRDNLNKSGGVLQIVDIGDSAGTHIKKIRTLLEDKGISIETMSVNLDPVAVEKIKANGENAILCRAEDYTPEGRVDLYLTFEMMEHLHNPALFLHHLAKADKGDHLLITVPYVANSRVALNNSMHGTGDIHAEAEHVFELSPADWMKLAVHSGWEVLEQRIYYQYPTSIPLYSALCKKLWSRYDFEGFLGLMLKKNMTVADRYLDWED